MICTKLKFMYKCDNCGCEFDEPLKYCERHGLDTPPYEWFFVSPCCFDSYIEVDNITGDDDECCMP